VIRRALVGTGSTAFTFIGACLIAFGIPLLWVWIASHIYTKSGAVSISIAAFIGTGIVVSYWGVLLLGSWIRARLLGRGLEPGPRRSSWNRSMRDTPYRPGEADPIERLFVITAIVCLIALAVWFFFLSGGDGGGGSNITGPADVI
jgi:hypothetical protein